MEILDNLEIIDLVLYLKKEETLILSDMHLGFEESLNKGGMLIPRFQFKDTMEKIKEIFSKVKVKKIILNGDFKHEFSKISETEWRNSLEVLDFFIKNSEEVILVKGNHDTSLEVIAEKRNLKVMKGIKINDYYICHGDVIPENLDFSSSKVLIIGHEHPAISLKSGVRVEKYKCFLKGKFKDKDLIVMPSFNLLTTGTNVLNEKLLSPFLKQDLDDFRVYIIQDKVYDFGKVKDLLD